MRPWGVGQVGGGCLGWSTIVYMSSGMFRGKESSNRIELSWLVQELSNFGVFGFLQLLGVRGWVDGVGGWVDGVESGWGCPPHTCTCMRGKHGNFMQMAAPIGFGETLGIPYDVICTCVHVHACMCICTWVGCSLSPPANPIHPPPHPQGGPQNHSKFNSTWTNRDISILFEDLKSVETPPPMGGCIIWWVGGWVDGWGWVKSLKIWKLLTESR